MIRMSTFKVSVQFEPPCKLNAVGTAQEPVANSNLVYLLRFPLKGSIIQLVCFQKCWVRIYALPLANSVAKEKALYF